MRRVAVLIAVVMMSLGWSAGVGAPLGTGAQEASPAAGEMGLLKELTADLLAYAPIDTSIDVPAVALIERVTIAPGALIPSDGETSPGHTVMAVESGVLTIRSEAPVTVTRADAIAAALADPGTLPAKEPTVAGADVTLEAGDTVAWPPMVSGDADTIPDRRFFHSRCLVGMSARIGGFGAPCSPVHFASREPDAVWLPRA